MCYTVAPRERERPGAPVHQLRRPPRQGDRAGPQRPLRERHARLADARRVRGRERRHLLRRARGPLRQPHRRGQVHAQRQGVHARAQQRAGRHPLRPARRVARLLAPQLDRAGGDPRRGQGGPRARDQVARRRGRLPRQRDRARHAHLRQQQRVAHRLEGDDRPGHAHLPHRPRLLEPRRRGWATSST